MDEDKDGDGFDSNADEEDFVAGAEMMTVPQEVVERDLSSKEINALVSVVMMLSGSETINGNVNPNYVKNQLYKDKQESIPEEALSLCAAIINTLRRITLKRDEDASFLSCYKIRHLRNVLVRFSGNKTKFREVRMSPSKDHNQNLSVTVNSITLYLLFCKEYNMFDEQDAIFTSYADLESDEAKSSLFENFFDWGAINRILREQNLKPRYSFNYTNQYDLKFLGEKVQKKETETKSRHDEMPEDQTEDQKSELFKNKNDIVSEINDLYGHMKSEKKEYAELSKQLQPEESKRMDLGRYFRAQERHKVWDDYLYQDLKKQRLVCNNIYKRMKRLNSSIKASGQKLYTLNKMLHSQSISVKPKSRLVVSNELRERLKKDRVLVQGIDPGIVTTASINCVKAGTLFESINRFYMLENEVSDIQHSQVCDYSYVHTASKVNAAALATNHRIKREKRQKEGKTENPISLERKRVTRKIRTKRYHKKNCSRYRSGMFKSHVLDVREGSVLTFVGDWSRNGTYIRGHERRSLDPVLKRLKCVEKDETFIVDEYKSTVNCSSCFEPTTKQIIRVGDHGRKRIKGAVTCTNEICPRRLSSRSSTINRDQNGAMNIALIGFCHLVSEDGLTLPPFRRSNNNSNKYEISEIRTFKLYTNSFA